MSIIKKIVSTVAACAVSIISFAALPFGGACADEPTLHMRVALVPVSDTRVRADIIFEGFPDFATAGFHVQFGSGFDVVGHTDSENKVWANYTSGTCSGFSIMTRKNSAHYAFVSASAAHNTDCNGVFISLYVDKNINYDPFTATANIVFTSTGNATDFICVFENNGIIISPNNIEDLDNPTMTGSIEYMIGDTTGNNGVDARDSTWILSAISDNGGVPIAVADILDTYTTYMPYAKCAEAADVNKDGYISSVDSQLVLSYYADMGAEIPYNGIIGTMDIYEIY